MVLVVVTVSFITFQLITKQASWEKMLKNVCEITSETFKVIVQNEKKMKGNFILNIINEGEEWKRRFLFYFFYIHKNSLWLFFGCSEDFNKFFLTSKKEKKLNFLSNLDGKSIRFHFNSLLVSHSDMIFKYLWNQWINKIENRESNPSRIFQKSWVESELHVHDDINFSFSFLHIYTQEAKLKKIFPNYISLLTSYC